jgi:hypothetical protein
VVSLAQLIAMLETSITNALLLWDLLTDYDIFSSTTFATLHRRWVARAGSSEARPVAEIDAVEASRDRVIEGSHDFTVPFVVRGAVAEVESLRNWGDPEFWLARYADELVLCARPEASQLVTLTEFFAAAGELYVAGATTIFERRPELKAMVDNELTRSLAPDAPGRAPLFHQVFMGWRAQGSTVHCAIGINLFRQITGRKKWYFMAPSQTPRVYPKIYANGYSATSRTIQASADDPGAPWFDRLERYTVTLEPGDLLINPPWWWHCVENLGAPGELVIGCPTRFNSAARALRVDPFKSLVAGWRRLRTRPEFGPGRGGIDDALAFERTLIENRDETDQSLVLR